MSTHAPNTASALAGKRPGVLTLRALAALLRYPDAQLRSHLAEINELLVADQVLSPARLADLSAFVDELRTGDAMETEMRYVELFDRGRSTSLHLFEHVHGDSRDRGPAMVDLGQTYAEAGLDLLEGELPDYLPVVIEFASTQPRPQAEAFLGEIAHLLNALFSALQERGGGYASVIGALMDLAGHTAEDVQVPGEQPLDEAWAEPAAFDGCASNGQAAPMTPQPVHIVRTQRRSA